MCANQPHLVLRWRNAHLDVVSINEAGGLDVIAWNKFRVRRKKDIERSLEVPQH